MAPATIEGGIGDERLTLIQGLLLNLSGQIAGAAAVSPADAAHAKLQESPARISVATSRLARVPRTVSRANALSRMTGLLLRGEKGTAPCGHFLDCMPRLRPPVPRSPIKTVSPQSSTNLGLCRRVTYGRWLWVGPMRRARRSRRPPCAGTVERISMMKTLFLQAPSFDGSMAAPVRATDEREVRSFWYPTWLAQPAALVEARSSSTRRASAQVPRTSRPRRRAATWW